MGGRGGGRGERNVGSEGMNSKNFLKGGSIEKKGEK